MPITLVTTLLTGLVAGLLWRGLFKRGHPEYLGGVIGGATAVLTWELLKRTQIR